MIFRLFSTDTAHQAARDTNDFSFSDADMDQMTMAMGMSTLTYTATALPSIPMAA
ncbi:hypothetical protein [uncultured Kocuria sp.]|uniref:hypothetical protein n=1 Tax=uncultured Kocuria sp. TaxID=259305 RepID=UPI00259434F1|nr:hypothetical protein [uncultured Kocuria sp.]MCT1366487.1 hypothetical protein [Rothia sp. p3-SID1597]